MINPDWEEWLKFPIKLDALSFLQSLPDKIVQCCVTSPPYYGLRVYQGGQEHIWPPTPAHLVKLAQSNAPVCKGHDWIESAVAPTKNAQVGSDDPKQQAYVDQSDVMFNKRQDVVGSEAGLVGDDAASEGDEAGGHEWEDHFMPPKGGKSHPDRPSKVGANKHMSETDIRGVGIWSSFCKHCGAWKGSLGLEPTPELFIWHLTLIFRELRRVLRDDGVLWLNIGDSYCGYKGENYSKDGVRGTGEESHVPKSHDIGTPHTSSMKPKDLMGVPWAVATALREDGWYLRSALPWLKCLSGGTMLYARTQKGEMPTMLRDLIRLDPATVQLWNGEKWTQVVSWSETPRPDDSIEIEFRSGERIGCTPDHRWPVGQWYVEAHELKVGDRIRTSTLPEPEQEDGFCLALDDELVGWFIGLYIAEGSKGGGENGRIQIAGHQKELEYRSKKIRKLCRAYHGSYTTWEDKDEDSNKSMIMMSGPMLFGLLDTYVAGKIAKDKHLTRRAWERSNKFIRALLDGYLHGDGSWIEKEDRWRLGFTNNDYLAADFRCIAARLGISLRLKRGFTSLDGEKFPCWRGQIRFDLSDKSINSGSFKKKFDNEIVGINKSRARHFYDVAVEDEPHLFALASGILTHNSNAMPEAVKDRPTVSHEYIFLLSKKPRYYYDIDAVRMPIKASSLQRNQYNWNSKQRTHSPDEVRGDDHREAGALFDKAGRNRRTGDFHDDSIDILIEAFSGYVEYLKQVKERGGLLHSPEGVPMALYANPKPYKDAHFAVFPDRLVEPLIKCASPTKSCGSCGSPYLRTTERVYDNPVERNQEAQDEGFKDQGKSRKKGSLNSGDFPTGLRVKTIGWNASCNCGATTKPAIVIDPFLGSGTVGMVAESIGRTWLGCDISMEYCEIALNRFKKEGTKLKADAFFDM